MAATVNSSMGRPWGGGLFLIAAAVCVGVHSTMAATAASGSYRSYSSYGR